MIYNTCIFKMLEHSIHQHKEQVDFRQIKRITKIKNHKADDLHEILLI